MSGRDRAHWVNCHELVRLDTLCASRCKHCDAVFGHEQELAGLPVCEGRRP